MEHDEIETKIPESFDHRASFAWWEQKRWIFNLAVGLVGIACVLTIQPWFRLDEFIGAIFYGLFANLFYSLGAWLEMADVHYLGGALKLHRARVILFLIGTIGSMLLTVGIAWLYAIAILAQALGD